jgi:hypothetical protein
MRFALPLVLLVAVLAQADIAAAQQDSLEVRIKKAARDYNDSVDKIEADIEELINKKIDAAKSKGDLDQKKSYDAALDALKQGEFPTLPVFRGVVESGKRELMRAKTKLLGVYKEVEREYVKQGKDTRAEAVRAESQRLDKAVWIERARDLSGESASSLPADIYLADLQEQNVSVGKEGTFRNTGDYAVGGKGIKKAIYLHPPSNGSSEVTYDVPPGFKVFKAIAAINDTGSAAQPTPLVFKLVGGSGTTLWTSKPLRGPGAAEPCEILLGQEKSLKLVVVCNGWFAHAHAIWGEARFSVRR